MNLERKLMKFWIQSFLLGVPKIIVGFRTQDGFLKRVEEMDTASIPSTVKRRGKGTWDGNMCINFASELLDCKFYSSRFQDQIGLDWSCVNLNVDADVA